MLSKIIKSRALVLVLLCSFTSLIFTEAMPLEQIAAQVQEPTPVFKVKAYGKKISSAQKKNFEQIIEEGRRLLQDEMDYEGAIIKFKEAGALAVTQPQKSDAYFYLSLAYYATIVERGEEDFKETVRRLIEVDYFRELDVRLCPPNYIDLFLDIKAEYGVLIVKSRPLEADVYIDKKEESSGKTPLTIGIRAGSIDIKVKKGNKEKEDTVEITAGQRTTSPIYVLKGKSGLLFVIGGIALAVGVGAVLFTSKKKNGGGTPSGPTAGNIQVNSTPTGANIFLDGTDTGRTTNATLTDVSLGSHTVKLQKEGYYDYEETVSITAGQTTTINTSLSEIVPEGGYEFVTKWGNEGSAAGQFSSPKGIAVGNDGYVYVADTGNDRIQKFTSDGVFVTEWGSSGSGSGQFREPWAIATDSTGKIFVADNTHNNVQVFTSDGVFVTEWGSSGSGSGQFRGPRGIAVSASGNVYVSCIWNHRIQKFTSDGTFLTEWGSQGSGDGQFMWPNGIAVDRTGYVYVAGGHNGRIQKFNSEGTFIAKWDVNRPEDVAVDRHGFLFAAEIWSYDSVEKFTSNGTQVSIWGGTGNGDGQFKEPYGIAVDFYGNVYVADTDNHRIQKFAPVFSAVQTSKSSPNLIRKNILNRNIGPRPRNLNLPRRGKAEREVNLTQRQDRKQKKKK